jgi:hypothetical protein
MALLAIFKSRIPSVNVVLPNGKALAFKEGVYRTADPYEVAYLEYEVKQNHPHIYIDEAEQVIDEALLDPMAALEAKFREKFLAEQAAAGMTISNSDQSPVVPASTEDVASVAADSKSGDGKLAMLKVSASK